MLPLLEFRVAVLRAKCTFGDRLSQWLSGLEVALGEAPVSQAQDRQAPANDKQQILPGQRRIGEEGIPGAGPPGQACRREEFRRRQVIDGPVPGPGGPDQKPASDSDGFDSMVVEG